MVVDRGSDWGKWDLHVHTPLSFESDFGISEHERERFSPIPELEDFDTSDDFDPLLWSKYIEELEGVEDVDCIAVTDYFSLEGYEIIQHLRNEGYLNNFDLVLPNIEFRIGTFTGDGKRINLHVIFSEEVTVDQIRHEFLTNLAVRLDDSDKRSLRRESLEEFGAQAKDYHSDAEGFTDYVAGCRYAWVQFEDIVGELSSSRSLFEGKHLIVLSGAEWSDINWRGQDAEIRRQLLADSHALFSANPSDRDWATGQGHLSEEEFKDEFNSLKPVIHGSDAHNFDRLCQPDGERYCWIKANHTFEGLKQVIFEPIERVHIGHTSPESFTQIHTIDSLQLRDGEVNSDLEIVDDNIPFNSNLVSVIGNQGSGKTALLDLIANCFDERTLDCIDDDNSFIGRIEGSSPTLETEISFAGDDVGPFTKMILEPTTVDGPDISYIPQGKIVEYCEQGNELHERIRSLITESVQRETTELITDFEQKRDDIGSLARKLRSANAELHEINPREVHADIAEEKSNLSQIETLFDNKQEEIDQFKETHQEQLEETEAEDLQSELDGLIDESNEIDELIADIDSALDKLGEVEKFNNLLEQIHDQQEVINSNTLIESIESASQQEQLNALRDDAEVAKEELSEEINEIRSDLGELDELDEELSELIDERRQIGERKSNTQENIDELEETKERVEELKEKRVDNFISYTDIFFELREIYGEISLVFSDGETEVLDEIQIEPGIELTQNRTSDFLEILDNRSLNRNEIRPAVEKLDEIVSGERPEDLDGDVRGYVAKMEEFRKNLLDSRDQIDFDTLLFGDCLELSEQIYYQETPMGQLSRGQKGTVLLRIYLAKGEEPLIIDSPEENLDNQYVFEELIGAVREAKKDRQIFIATHDANLVVNTDSEQIVIAEFDQGEITFDGGALEDQDIRDSAKGILEGGDEAFRLREEKYDLTPE